MNLIKVTGTSRTSAVAGAIAGVVGRSYPAGERSCREIFRRQRPDTEKLEMIGNSLRDNAKVVITEYGISLTLSLGSLPVIFQLGMEMAKASNC